MDHSESTKVVFQRIEELEPQHISKIIGYLLLKDHGELEMLRLAFAPDLVLQNLINDVKETLVLSPQSAATVSNHVSSPDLENKPLVISKLPKKFTPFMPFSSSTTALPTYNNGLWIPPQPRLVQNFHRVPPAIYNSAPGEYNLHNMSQPQLLPLEDQLKSCHLDGPFYLAQNNHPEHAMIIPVPNQMFPSSSEMLGPRFCHELSMQVCDSFRKGYCRHGGSCRLLHVFWMENSNLMVLNPPNTDDMVIPEHVLLRGSLKQLEMELIELLRGKRGIPVSVSSLPILYYDKYGKVLQVEGFLLANHRQGKFFCRMTQILAQMTKNIRLIDRPHGRHSIILVEGINKHMKLNEEENGRELQVYLTFLPQSLFSEQDVHAYFNNFGPVQEIRIPHRAKRMFGYVTFAYPETAALVLTKSNPHYICGAEVLVKPYRLKPMLVDRKPKEKIDPQSPAS